MSGVQSLAGPAAEAAASGRIAEGFQDWLDEHESELAPFREVAAVTIEDVVRDLRPLHQRLHEAGWSALGWPAEAGGLGGPAIYRGIVHEGLTRAGFRLPDAMLILETLGPMVVEFSPKLAAAYLPAALRGEELWCQGFSEPDAGSDLAALRCRAEIDGSSLVISGQKTWVSFGHLARRCGLLVRTGDADSRHRGLTMVLVDLDGPGITTRPIRAASGRNEFAELFFDEAVVPLDRVIGEVGGGWAAAMYLLQWERGMYAWQRQAALHTELQNGLRRAGSLSASIQTRLGAAFRELQSLRLASRRTLQRLSAGENPGPEISADKLLLSRAEQVVFDVVSDLRSDDFLFGDGEEPDSLRADHFYSRAASIYGGSAEVQRSILADRVLTLPKERDE